jgi:hypothetical protein
MYSVPDKIQHEDVLLHNTMGDLPALRFPRVNPVLIDMGTNTEYRAADAMPTN